MALHPTKLSELSTEKIIEMFVQANPRKLSIDVNSPKIKIWVLLAVMELSDKFIKFKS